MYNDFQEKLDHREELLDPEKAPEERLVLYAHWMGLELTGGYLDTEVLRTLVREAGELNRRKGTKSCIERICQIMLGETPKIVERSLLQRYVRTDNEEQINRLYGDSPFDVTLMIRTPVDEQKKKQLLLLLNQFKPVRSRLRMVYLQESGVLDGHTYLDQNALTFTQSDGVLDAGQLSDGTIVLQ
jgi:phage tail-like protein